MLPLSGVKVLTLENFIAGPLATMWLADAGAEVVKIETPTGGDQSRSVEPQRERDGLTRGLSFLRANRNKKSVALDLKDEKDQATFWRLVEVADVFLENLNPSSLERLGVTYKDVSSHNPGIIYATVSGFGVPEFNEGELPFATAFDIVAHAMSGLLFRPEGSEEKPVYAGFPLADIFASSMAQAGIYQALYHRERTGEGARIDIALLDGAVALNELSLIMTGALGEIPPPGLHGFTAPFGAYKAADGYVVVGVLGEPVWERFATAIGKPHLVERPEFGSGIRRHRNRVELDAEINEWLHDLTVAEVIEALTAQHVPVAAALKTDAVLESEYLRQRKMVVTVDDPVWGPTKMAGNPLHSSLMEDMKLEPGPELGGDTEDVLARWLGDGQA